MEVCLMQVSAPELKNTCRSDVTKHGTTQPLHMGMLLILNTYIYNGYFMFSVFIKMNRMKRFNLCLQWLRR